VYSGDHGVLVQGDLHAISVVGGELPRLEGLIATGLP